MRTPRLILAVLPLLLLAGVVSADEVIYFTNGTSMAIHSHEVKDDMIHVDLGSKAIMAFPMRMVEKVESAGKIVNLKASGGNRMVSDRASSNAGGANRFAKSQPLDAPQRRVEEMNGVAVERPFANSAHAGKRQMARTANRAAMGSSARPGSTRVGSKNQIGAAGQSGVGPRGGPSSTLQRASQARSNSARTNATTNAAARRGSKNSNGSK